MNFSNVILSGFRSQTLTDRITALGGTVGVNLTKKTSLLVYDVDGKKGTKVDKARAQGIPVMTRVQFEAALDGTTKSKSLKSKSASDLVVPPQAKKAAKEPKKAPTAPKATKTCAEGKIRNPTTGRCVIDKKPLEKKQPKGALKEKVCKEGKVLNPATGRCIKGKKMANDAVAVAVAAVPAAPARLPKLWEFDSTDDSDADEDVFDQSMAYFKKIKAKLQPGDVIYPTNGYRGEGILVVGPKKNAMSPILEDNGAPFLAPWAIELGMQNGFSQKQLMDIYKKGPFYYIIYPKDAQGSNMVVEKGAATSILAYDCMSDEDAIINEDDNAMNFFSDFKVKDLFL